MAVYHRENTSTFNTHLNYESKKVHWNFTYLKFSILECHVFWRNGKHHYFVLLATYSEKYCFFFFWKISFKILFYFYFSWLQLNFVQILKVICNINLIDYYLDNFNHFDFRITLLFTFQEKFTLNFVFSDKNSIKNIFKIFSYVIQV